ncbi:hypothetical protein TPSD3_12255 [Thioflexithrix psekupsensis]|uniref:Copper resistance protein D domain-containing protein n=1 Tax=Thioflexithrix psekupsensis TaxID=1570016 RepID=A0A251X5X5_9GAMM|nr:hypothetical protein TPSD3_12255 [Thioflexithrix psekupsensis]
MPLMLGSHLIFSLIWVGGMFFAYMALRPAAAKLLEPEWRQTLWLGVFSRFFFWVWLSIGLILLSGLWLIRHYGGMGEVKIHVHIMFTLGLVMMVLFLHLFFSPYRKFKQSVLAKNWALGGKYLNQIRWIIATNLTLGLLIILMTVFGKYSAIFTSNFWV